jgi:hypothetical protein
MRSIDELTNCSSSTYRESFSARSILIVFLIEAFMGLKLSMALSLNLRLVFDLFYSLSFVAEKEKCIAFF